MTSQYKSEFNSDSQQTNPFYIEFANLLNKILSMLKEELFEQISQKVIQKYQSKQSQSHKIMSETVQNIFKYLLNKLESCQSLCEIFRGVTTDDYAKLQENLQQRQESIRNHFKIEIQQKIYQNQLEQQIFQLQKVVQENKDKMKGYQQKIQKLQTELRDHAKHKVRYSSLHDNDNKQSTEFLHKASLNIKHRKRDPYLDCSLARSRQVVSRPKAGSKILKDRGSKLVFFDSLSRQDTGQPLVPTQSMSHHASKVMSRAEGSKLQIGRVVQMAEERKRRGRYSKLVTQGALRQSKDSSLGNSFGR